MTVIASYSIKGGVGKTSTAVNLASMSAAQGYRTLLWDLDPQGSASYYFRIKAKVKGGGKSLLSQKNITQFIKGTDYPNLDLLPADFSLRKWDLLLNKVKQSKKSLQKKLVKIAPEYDYIFLDCPPGLTLLTENIFSTANIILTPIIPTSLSVQTLHQLLEFNKKKRLNLVIYAFFSMVDKRKKMHQKILQELPKQINMLTCKIPYASDIEAMGMHRQALIEFARSSTSTRAYEALWEEICKIINKERL